MARWYGSLYDTTGAGRATVHSSHRRRAVIVATGHEAGGPDGSRAKEEQRCDCSDGSSLHDFPVLNIPGKGIRQSLFSQPGSSSHVHSRRPLTGCALCMKEVTAGVD